VISGKGPRRSSAICSVGGGDFTGGDSDSGCRNVSCDQAGAATPAHTSAIAIRKMFGRADVSIVR
jgi:hypothetical protein